MTYNKNEITKNKKIYMTLGFFTLLLIPFLAILKYGFTTSVLLDNIIEYMFVLIGFLWTPLMFIYAILNWDFDARYLPIFKILFWIIPPLFFLLAINEDDDINRDHIIAAYMFMFILMALSLIILIVMIGIFVIFAGVDPFESIKGI